jgi:hypothetical protein
MGLPGNPVLVVEALSDSTEARDRGEKWAHYRHACHQLLARST